jgi:sporulation protein YlmC with PRC-barrel domain
VDQPTGSVGSAAISEQDRERIGMMQDNQQTGQAAEVQASQLLNKQVVNRDGDRLGTITAIRRQGNEAFVVIDHGGVLSLQQTEFLVPSERLALDGQGRVMLMGLTQRDFSAIPRMELTAGQEVSAEQTVRISQAQ